MDIEEDHERSAKFRAVLAEVMDPPSPNSSSSSNPNGPLTPLEKQVVELKSRYKGCLLMVECGYRFRFFGDDADCASQALGIWTRMDHNFLVASIPTFRVVHHLKRLVAAGYRVALVRQTETAAIKKAQAKKGKGTQ